MQIQNNRKIDLICTILLYVAPIAGVGSFCMVQNEDVISALSNFVITLILAGIYSTLLHINHNALYQKISKLLLYFGSFFLSCVILGGSAGIPMGVFWMLAVVLAALDAGIELALSTHVVLMVQYALLLLPEDNGFYRFLAYILLGLVVSLLFSQLKEKKAVPYLALILIACDGVLQCVVYRFNLVQIRSNIVEIMIELGSLLIFVGIGAIYLCKCKVASEDSEDNMTEQVAASTSEDALAEQAVTSTSEDALAMQGQVVLQKLTEPGYELLERLKAYSDELYAHSTRIGLLSKKAAEVIGGDAELAKAGGMYHEIGRIEDEKDYIEAGTKIGQEHDFPEELLAVMRQHSTGFELPTSVEAAVVMLSDCIISTSDFLAKSGKRDKISDKQLVMSVFKNRIDKGNLERSGITAEQIQKLQEFYIDNTFSEER